MYAAGSYNRSSCVHWSRPTRRTRASSRTTALRTIQRILNRVFVSDERVALTRDAIKRQADACQRCLATKGATVNAFVRIRAIVHSWYESTRPVPSRVPPALASYIYDVITFIARRNLVLKLPLKTNISCLTYGILQLLTSGFAPMGVCAVRRLSFAARHGITPSQYARLPGIRARQQSISVRQLQRICVDDSGHATLQFPVMAADDGASSD